MNKPTLESLQAAFSNGDLTLHYQPKVCLLSGQVTGAEALVRWEGTEQDVLGPDEFLPLAVESGMLHDITIDLLDQVIDACQRLRKVRTGLSISMNVAPDDLASQTISQRIGQSLHNGEISADELQIEITEAAAMRNVDVVRDDLVRLRDLGIHVLMDDFGTGWSSIDRLSQLPFSSLKLDQGIVQRMGTSQQNLNTVRAAISMARELRMVSVAEGVESDGAFNFLIAAGCGQAQGYYISRPLPLEQFLEYVANPPTFAGSHIGWIHQNIDNLIQQRKSMFDAAICLRMGAVDSLQSVRVPALARDIEKTRVGLWYFGAGQQLADRLEFQAIEAPYRKMHDAVCRCLDLVEASSLDGPLDDIIEQVDVHYTEVIRCFHALERVLLTDL